MSTEIEHGGKSEAIRDLLDKNPEAKGSEIVAALDKKGIEVTPALVSNIKTKLKSGGKKSKKAKTKATGAKRGPKPGRKTLLTSATSGNDNPLHKAAVFAKECGSIENARAVLAELETILSVQLAA